MLFSRLSALPLFVAAASAQLDLLGFIIHEVCEVIPQGFRLSGPAPSDSVLDLRINLAQRDLEGLETRLGELSDPSHADFRNWLSASEVQSFAQPSQATKDAAQQFLRSHGITDAQAITPAGDWIAFKAPVETAARMFSANFSVFTHTATGQDSIRTLEYSLPENMRGVINVVHPMTTFNRPINRPPVVAVTTNSSTISARSVKKHKSNKHHHNHKPKPAKKPTSGKNSSVLTTSGKGSTAPSAASLCAKGVIPACLQALYNIPATAAKSASNSLAVTGFVPQYVNKQDLKTFLKAYRSDIPSNTNFSVVSVDGGDNSKQDAANAGLEANLDVQYTLGVATKVPIKYYAIGTNYQDGDDMGFLDVINQLAAEYSPPQVVTTSYGFDTEADLSPELSKALCQSYMQLTARGVSILFATGDGGVASTPGVECDATFPPTFPTCPYVTLVGGTEGVPEKGADLSAGGFSNYFKRANFQDKAVSAYLKKLGNKYKGKFNASGRAYPDVSAQAKNVQVVIGGQTSAVQGTSASSPIFASVIALLNDELITRRRKPLGFLNPWLYANPQAFNDITSGNNPGCGTDGFSAVEGWDPVTGLGSPDYVKLRKAAGLSY